ncbi:hypothetical protein RIF29_38544 [Crotalaria pallida]|uniref:Uncharacterized protein n=1 Tax=Crotalaria pallida TaxID=3830 RepID=A0AAN9DZI2_CROPI
MVRGSDSSQLGGPTDLHGEPEEDPEEDRDEELEEDPEEDPDEDPNEDLEKDSDEVPDEGDNLIALILRSRRCKQPLSLSTHIQTLTPSLFSFQTLTSSLFSVTHCSAHSRSPYAAFVLHHSLFLFSPSLPLTAIVLRHNRDRSLVAHCEPSLVARYSLWTINCCSPPPLCETKVEGTNHPSSAAVVPRQSLRFIVVSLSDDEANGEEVDLPSVPENLSINEEVEVESDNDELDVNDIDDSIDEEGEPEEEEDEDEDEEKDEDEEEEEDEDEDEDENDDEDE